MPKASSIETASRGAAAGWAASAPLGWTEAAWSDASRFVHPAVEAELKKRDSAVGAHTVELKLKRAINRIKAHDDKRSG